MIQGVTWYLTSFDQMSAGKKLPSARAASARSLK